MTLFKPSYLFIFALSLAAFFFGGCGSAAKVAPTGNANLANSGTDSGFSSFGDPNTALSNTSAAGSSNPLGFGSSLPSSSLGGRTTLSGIPVVPGTGAPGAVPVSRGARPPAIVVATAILQFLGSPGCGGSAQFFHGGGKAFCPKDYQATGGGVNCQHGLGGMLLTNAPIMSSRGNYPEGWTVDCCVGSQQSFPDEIRVVCAYAGPNNGL